MECVERHGHLFEFDGASAVSGMYAGRCVPETVARRIGSVRRTEGDEWVLAEPGRGAGRQRHRVRHHAPWDVGLRGGRARRARHADLGGRRLICPLQDEGDGASDGMRAADFGSYLQNVAEYQPVQRQIGTGDRGQRKVDTAARAEGMGTRS